MRLQKRRSFKQLVVLHYFSLVELLVVIAIISILAGLLLPALRNAMDQARLISCLNQHKQSYLALTLFADDHRNTPPLGDMDSLISTLYSGSDPRYGWYYTGMAQVWAQGYFEDLNLLVCPGFANHVDEMAAAWQERRIIQPGGDRTLLADFEGRQNGVNVDGVVKWRSGVDANHNGYHTGTYTMNLRQVGTAIPAPLLTRFPPSDRFDWPVFLCAQSIYNPNQAGAPWYNSDVYDSHKREGMNCTYRDGSAKPLQGVRDYADQLYLVGGSAWQYTATDYPTNGQYWWGWASSQR